MTAIYRGMSREALDAAYNNQKAVVDFPGLVATWRRRSEDVAQRFRARLDLTYGSLERQRIDLFPSTQRGAPVLVFIHGGYWQGGEKRSVGFLAEGPLASGFAVAFVEYTVAPESTMAEMVEEIRASLIWLRTKAEELGFDGSTMLLAGHSAGAQLLCYVLDQPGIVGGVAISGLYDLEPIRLSYLNEKLALTERDVERFSPMRNLPLSRPLLVAVGANELPELIRQSRDFAAAVSARYCPLDGHDHFSVLDELASPDGQLCQLLKLLASPLSGCANLAMPAKHFAPPRPSHSC